MEEGTKITEYHNREEEQKNKNKIKTKRKTIDNKKINKKLNLKDVKEDWIFTLWHYYC